MYKFVIRWKQDNTGEYGSIARHNLFVSFDIFEVAYNIGFIVD